MRTIEEITNAMTALVDAATADNRSLSDEEITNYEDMEAELKKVQTTENIRSRNAAYNSVVIPAGVPSGRNVNNAMSDEVRGFINYLRTGVGNDDISHLQSDINVSNAQGEGVSTAGGYLVPTEFRNKLIEIRKSFGGFLNNVDRLSTSDGRPIEWPTNDDTANLGQIVPEHSSSTGGADLTFGQVNLGAYTYDAIGANDAPIRVSVELLRDSVFDFETLVGRQLAQRIHRKQAAHAVVGTGVGEPLGILAASLTSDKDIDTPDAADYEDLVELQDLLDEEYTTNAKWLMKKNTWSQLRLLVDGAGRPLLMEQNDSIQGVPTKRLLGHEVIIDEAAPTLSSAGDTYPIAFGDFKEAYIWRTVGNVVVMVNPYSRMANRQVEIYAYESADGTIQNRTAYKILQNNT